MTAPEDPAGVCGWCQQPVPGGAEVRLGIEQGSSGGAEVGWHRRPTDCAPRDRGEQPRRHP